MASSSHNRSRSLGGISLKRLTLIGLSIQASAHVLIMHYSRIMPPVNGQRYFISTAVLLNEILKLTISLTMALFDIAISPKTADTSTATGLFKELARAVFTGDSWKLAIPAMLYTLQNSLQYVAVGNLDAATFSVTNQVKLVTTAVFSMVFLRNSLNGRRWSILALMLVGVAIVQIPLGSSESSVLSIKDLRGGVAFHEARHIWDLEAAGNGAAGQLSKRSATYEGIDEDFAAANPEVNPFLGLVAALMACIISGFAGSFFEKVLKETRSDQTVSVWVRNVQLSFYSMWPALFIGVLFQDGEYIAKTGFFTGYNWAVWTAIVLQAFGGMLVALVINNANNTVKTYATSVSILSSFFASVLFFDFEVSLFYLIGTAIVLTATYLYHTAVEDSKPKPPQIRIPEPEKGSEQSYFDLEALPTLARSPLRSPALTTSRPSTPTFERRLHRTKSGEFRFSKRQL